MLGQKVPSYPDVIKKMKSIGCELGNHSYDHADLSKLDPAGIQSQMSRTNDGIRNITGSGATLMQASLWSDKQHCSRQCRIAYDPVEYRHPGLEDAQCSKYH